MTSRKIVLLGGRGFIGRAVQQRLGATCSVSAPGHADCDVTNVEQVRQACANADVVVNLVGVLDERHPGQFDACHHTGPLNVARAVAECGGQSPLMIHVSAIGADVNSRIAYPRSKGLGERALYGVFNTGTENRLRCLILRPSLVVGRGDQFLNRFAMLTKWLPVFPVFGRGTSRFQPVHVDNLASIIASACTMPSQYNCPPVLTFEVGGPVVHTFKEILVRTTRKSGMPTWMQWFVPPLLIHLPVRLALMQAWLMERLVPVGSPLRITRDQITQLQLDNTVNSDAGDQVETVACTDGHDVGAAVKAHLVCDIDDWLSIDDVFRAGEWLDSDNSSKDN